MSIDDTTILLVAAEAVVDPRTVRNAIAASRGERPPIRGRAGERVRAALYRRGLIGARA